MASSESDIVNCDGDGWNYGHGWLHFDEWLRGERYGGNIQ